MKHREVLSTPLFVLCLSLILFGQNQQISPALKSLVEAERAFAKMGAEKGIRESFLAYFAEDGINFQPHPIKTREAFLKQPAPTRPQPFTLNWEPIYADVSNAGDLGYNTGPFWITDKSPQQRPPQYGYFFSIWKKQSDGQWKVALDAGVSTPVADEATLKAGLRAAPPSGWKPTKTRDLEAERVGLQTIERAFSKTSQSSGTAAAFSEYADENARLHRNGVMPVLGKPAIQKFLSDKRLRLDWEPMKSDVASSADLGYTYGKYSATEADSKVAENGYYVHVWRKDKSGKWKLVLHTTNPVPPENK
jgi:ketosteroid isomerase-like protein